MIKTKFKCELSIIFILIIGIFLIQTGNAEARKKKHKRETPQSALKIIDHQWRLSGTGNQALLKFITIQNLGKKSYENISIEVDLYSYTDIPQGSIRSTIRGNIPSGSTKTFINLSFGIISTDLEKTVFRITGADIIQEEGQLLPKDLILVKDWEWSGGSYGTEGILKYITLENISDKNYKNIEINIEYSEIADTEVVPFRAIIKDFLPANSEKTFTDINIGFRYSGSRSENITVLNAKRVYKKEFRLRMAKKGIKIDEDTPGMEAYSPSDIEINIEDRNLTLAERYRKYVLKSEPQPKTDSEIIEEEIDVSVSSPEVYLEDQYAYYEEEPAYPTRIDNALGDEEMLVEEARLYPKIFKDIVIVSASAESRDDTQIVYQKEEIIVYQKEEIKEQQVFVQQEQEKNKNFISRAFGWSKDLVGLSDDEYYEEEDDDEYEDEVALKTDENSTRLHPYTDVEEVSGIQGDIEDIENYDIEVEGYQEPLPSLDIEVGGFKMRVSFTGTIGVLDEITLINKSNITYSNIKLEATSYARTDSRPLGSYKFSINEILPKRTKRTFRNIKIGFLSSDLEDIKIRITDAIYIN